MFSISVYKFLLALVRFLFLGKCCTYLMHDSCNLLQHFAYFCYYNELRFITAVLVTIHIVVWRITFAIFKQLSIITFLYVLLNVTEELCFFFDLLLRYKKLNRLFLSFLTLFSQTGYIRKKYGGTISFGRCPLSININ